MLNRILVIASAAALLGAIGFGAHAAISTIPTPEHISVLPASPAIVTPAASPSASVTPTPSPAPMPPKVTLSVRATATMRFSPTLTPADFVNVFHLVDPAHGYLASGGTTYLIAHSYAVGHGAPGNAWEKLRAGDVVQYNGHNYLVNRVATPGKGGIKSQPVWYNDPNMLVMITCVSRGPGNPATNNDVIRLERIS